MAEARQIDVDARRFYLAMGATVILFFGPLLTWTGFYHGGINAAFVASLLIALGLTAGIVEFARRRIDPDPLTWGEAVLAATYVFLLLFWIYGVWPHQWLAWADSEMNWRSDRILAGPTWGPDGTGLFEWILPFTLTYQVMRDIVVVTLYGLGLAAQIWLWSIWQNRNNTRSVEVEKTAYGRPLQRV